MQKKTHLTFGLFLASVFFALGMPFEYVLLIGFMSFFPDIDWLVDKIWFKEDSIFKKFWFKVFKTKSLHRTFLHNIWVLIGLEILLAFYSRFNVLLMFGVFLGYISHLFLDSLTVSGIYWLWPYGDEKRFGVKKFYMNGSFVTGSLKEKFLSTILLIVGGLLFAYGFYRMQHVTIQDVYQFLIYVIMFASVGIIFMYRLTQTLSRATSRFSRW